MADATVAKGNQLPEAVVSAQTNGAPDAPLAEGAQAGAVPAPVLNGIATHAPAELAVTLEGDELLAAIRKQVEYYFSRENLASDAYLVQHMNSQMFVPIAVVAGFTNMRRLTTDAELIKRALKSSTEAILDPSGTMVKPNIKVSRNTLVLREISADTTAAEITAVFDGEGCPKPESVKSDINDTWFVAFDTEEDCMEAHMSIRNRTLKGKPLKARVKSENLLRSFYKPGEGASNLPSPISATSANGLSATSPNGSYMGRNSQGQIGSAYYGQGLSPTAMAYGYGGGRGQGRWASRGRLWGDTWRLCSSLT
ncbi:hypothetical protein T492DRAFT_134326 [Pavlovales sp. CCMP2436]|nr:hypothetical protein T492DRAFT_134326 [Pavlovales sp. CCMP2436]